MSRRARWLWVAVAAVLLLGLAIGRALDKRRQAPAAAAPAASATARAVELAATDLVRAARSELLATLAVAGGLKAVDTAVVKAKVAAELRELGVREGDTVRAGQLIGRLDATEFEWRLRQAEDQAAAAQAQLDIAERTLANNRALVDQGFISRNALDTAASSAQGARASLHAAQATAEIARKAVRDTELRAPLSGQVSQRLAQPGERVPLDGRIVEIVDLSRLELEVAVPADDVVNLRVGQRARVQVDGMTAPLDAVVARINPSAQGGTRAVLAYLAVSPAPGLRQGLFARGTVETERRPALVVPAHAVRHDRGHPYVLVVAEGRAVQREVQPGGRGEVDFGAGREAAVEVLSGLDAGDLVLRGTVGTLPAGTALQLPPATRP